MNLSFDSLNPKSLTILSEAFYNLLNKANFEQDHLFLTNGVLAVGMKHLITQNIYQIAFLVNEDLL